MSTPIRQKTFTITGAVTDYDVKANNSDLWPAATPANTKGHASSLMFRANLDITYKLIRTGNGSFPLYAGEVATIDEADIDNLFITTSATTIVAVQMVAS